MGVFVVTVDLDAVQAVLQLDTSEEPGADWQRSGFYGDVEVDGFAAVHVDNLLRDAGHVNLGHHWNIQEICDVLIVF